MLRKIIEERGEDIGSRSQEILQYNVESSFPTTQVGL